MKNSYKNPYLYSVFAEMYIMLVALVIRLFGKPNTPDTIFDPIVALSLFVLSAAVMGYLFLGEPLQLYLSGEKQRAVAFFMKTVLSFAVITLLIMGTVKLLG